MVRWLALLLLAAGLSLGVAAARIAAGQTSTACAEQPFAEAQVEGHPRLTLELAVTPAQRMQGLMFRPSLPPDQGMLFIFENDTSTGFWMRNTLIPLSIAYLDAGGTVLDIQDMQPLTETIHAPAAPYRYALEVNQGWFTDHGVGIGDVFALCLPDHLPNA